MVGSCRHSDALHPRPTRAPHSAWADPTGRLLARSAFRLPQLRPLAFADTPSHHRSGGSVVCCCATQVAIWVRELNPSFAKM